MHIPDGFLNAPVALGTGVVSAAALIRVVRQINQNIEAEDIPLMGVLASFVFMLQLFSFPILGGTSAHLSGVLLVSILLGPKKGFLIGSVSLMALALLFQHGGLFSLGANILNMSLVGSFLGFWFFRILPGKSISIILAGCFSGVVSAFLCALELSSSDMLVLSTGLPSMLAIYAITGLIEGGATLLILNFISRVKPDLIPDYS